eukprot:7400105-Pyramimonas_sp.AAC.1
MDHIGNWRSGGPCPAPGWRRPPLVTERVQWGLERCRPPRCLDFGMRGSVDPSAAFSCKDFAFDICHCCINKKYCRLQS